MVVRELLLGEPKREILCSRNVCGMERDPVAPGVTAGLKGMLQHLARCGSSCASTGDGMFSSPPHTCATKS